MSPFLQHAFDKDYERHSNVHLKKKKSQYYEIFFFKKKKTNTTNAILTSTS
jgi:hypothetical protein